MSTIHFSVDDLGGIAAAYLERYDNRPEARELISAALEQVSIANTKAFRERYQSRYPGEASTAAQILEAAQGPIDPRVKDYMESNVRLLAYNCDDYLTPGLHDVINSIRRAIEAQKAGGRT